MNTRSIAYFLLLIACVLAGCVSYHAPEAHREAQPKIYPDYAGVTFPVIRRRLIRRRSVMRKT